MLQFSEKGELRADCTIKYKTLKMGAFLTCSNRGHEIRVARGEWVGSKQAQMGMAGIWSKRKQVMGADHVGIMRILSGGLLEIN